MLSSMCASSRDMPDPRTAPTEACPSGAFSPRAGRRIAALVAASLSFAPAHAQSLAEFYKAKGLTIYVGSEAGSGYDIPARVLARHMGRYLPGQPSIVVKNMPGANGIVVTNYMAARAPKDGSEIAGTHNTIVIDAMLNNDAVRFRPDELQWIGSTSPTTNTCTVWRTAPAQTFEQAREKELRIGATSATDATAIVPRFINRFTGTKMKIVRGYKGTSQIYLAMESGEIDGVCAAWDSILKWRPAGLSSPDIKVLVQVNANPDPLLPGIAFVKDLAQNPADRAALNFLTARQAFARPFIAPPGTEAVKVAALRKAFADTMRDAEFLADAQKSQVPIEPMQGEAVQDYIAQLLKTPKEVVDAANEATRPEP